MSRKHGWAFVDEQMQRQIDRGVTTAEHYREHLEEEGLMPAWLRYQKWTEQHPGEEVPEKINRVGGMETKP